MKTIKKILISSLSILGISFSIWILFLLNPQLSYAHQTQFSQVTVFHNLDLEEGTEAVIEDALRIVQSAEIYDDQLNIQLCLNDDKYYPHLHPFAGGNAYAYFDKTVMFACDDNFDKNETRFRWAINDYELRKFNLTQLLAHEFMHNYQSNFDAAYYVKNTLGKINWKLEGHAEYIARGYKSDGLLKEKLAAGETVLVDFAASWCSTCKRQERVINELRAANPAFDENISFIKVDWDQFGSHEVATSRKVPRRSTLLLLRGDEELGRIVAGTNSDEIKALLELALA